MKHVIYTILFLMLVTPTIPAFTADDPSIKGEVRTGVQSAMNDHVKENTLGEEYIIYDSGDGNVKGLTFKELHSGIVTKGDFYVSCADFTDSSGNLYDVDFLVAESNGELRVYQALVHKVNGEKRKYQVEGN